MSERLVKLFATFFYIGNIPVAPGSMASIAGVLIWLLLQKFLPVYILLFLLVTIIGFKVCDPMEKLMKEKDPSCIVIDEVSGVMIAFFLLPVTWPVIVTAFFLFRAFDMFKIYPVNKFEELPGAVGVMMDDVIARVYTCITMHVAICFAGV